MPFFREREEDFLELVQHGEVEPDSDDFRLEWDGNFIVNSKKHFVTREGKESVS